MTVKTETKLALETAYTLFLFYCRYTPLTKVVCCCALSWRLERPVRRRVPTKMFTPEWTPTSRSFEQNKKRQNCSVSHHKHRSHIPKVTGGQLLSSSRSLKTSSHSAIETSETRLQPGPVSAHRNSHGFVFTADYKCLCLEIMSGRWLTEVVVSLYCTCRHAWALKWSSA